MATTKRLLVDQILFKLSGGYPDVNFPVQKEDVTVRLEQKINSILKIQQFSMTLPSGETYPENLSIGTYENIGITTSGYVSYSMLPVMPISLPRNAGIYLIYEPNNPDNAFIPIMRGQRQLLKTDNLLSDLMGQISYEPSGRKIIYNKDLTLMGYSIVTMELVVMDISLYSESDILPIPADWENQIIDELYKEFMVVTPEAGLVNPYTNAGQKQNN